MSKANIFIVGGGKGGVGKTMTSITLIDWLLYDKQSANVTLIETDDSNPDVYKTYQKTDTVTKEVINLDAEAGWVKLMNNMPNWAKYNTQVVVNTAARATPKLIKYIGDVQSGANELKMQLHFLWPINRQKDSLILLHDVISKHKLNTTVVKNLYFGEAGQFALFDTTEFTKNIKSIELPSLNDVVADRVYSDRLTLNDADKFHFGERSSLARYRASAYEQFNKLA